MTKKNQNRNNTSKPLTYRSAGVDIAAGNELARRIAKITKSKQRKEVVSGVGGFAGITAIPQGYHQPYLVSGTDGVGTKLKIAFATQNHKTIGIDLVAMCVNDILTVGAEPLFFLDYLSTGQLEIDTAESVISGIVDGCHQAGCSLLGGETAEMPGMYADGEYDLAGFAVGVVERSKLIDGSRVEPGDAVIGLPSSGLHSNGYSLARKVLINNPSDLGQYYPELQCKLGHSLLIPTRIYVSAIKEALRALDVKAMAHITGGGLVENPPRCIKDTLAVRLDTTTWQVPPIMDLIAQQGHISLDEMRLTFNMGLGMIIIIPLDQVQTALDKLSEYEARQVGEIILRTGKAVEFHQ